MSGGKGNDGSRGMFGEDGKDGLHGNKEKLEMMASMEFLVPKQNQEVRVLLGLKAFME